MISVAEPWEHQKAQELLGLNLLGWESLREQLASGNHPRTDCLSWGSPWAQPAPGSAERGVETEDARGRGRGLSVREPHKSLDQSLGQSAGEAPPFSRWVGWEQSHWDSWALRREECRQENVSPCWILWGSFDAPKPGCTGHGENGILGLENLVSCSLE